MPTTFGIFVPGGARVVVEFVVVEFVVVTGPSETSRPTIDPRAALVPWTGTCEMTSPTGFADGMRETRVRKRAAVSFAVACASVRPTTRGTGTVPDPFETVSTTVEPLAARPSAAGAWLTTVSRGFFEATLRALPFKPAA